MGLKITLAGQDITKYVAEETIQIKDVLGQGAGAGGGSTGRAATAEFTVKMGPANSAVGAGSHITSPQLVRLGEVIIYDSTGNAIFGGYAGQYYDNLDKTQQYTDVLCYDYWQELDRVQIQKVYSGQSDVYIINDLIKTYTPWLDRSQLPTTGSYTFPVKTFKAITLQKALAQITDVTGYQIWITPNKQVQYKSPYQSPTAPFKLSDTPDFVSTFPHQFLSGQQGVNIDDTSAINRVTFYGGKKPSNDFTQDLSTQANGSNKLFVLAYYPRVALDGSVHIRASSINGTNDLTMGYLLGKGTQNQLKSQGGMADVLLNADAHTLTFDIAPTNSGPGSVTCTYRYEYPMNIQITDQSSYQFFGRWLDGVISDSTVFDSATATARCRTLLAEQSKGLTTLQLKCWKGGVQAGQILHVVNQLRGINNAYIVQEVDTAPLGAGNFEYTITLGAWTWNIVDAVMSTIHAVQQASVASSSDPNDNGQGIQPVVIQQEAETLHVRDTYTKQTKQFGKFYARLAPVGDGHDAYPGVSTIGS
jgi:hypothetical protein